MNRKDLGRSTDPRQERATTPTPCNPSVLLPPYHTLSFLRLPSREKLARLSIYKYIYRNARTPARARAHSLYTFVCMYVRNTPRECARARDSNPFCSRLPPPPGANASECPSPGTGAPPHTPLLHIGTATTRSIVEQTVRNRCGTGSDTQTYTHTATARSSR